MTDLIRPWLSEALDRVDYLATLEEDWDSYGSDPINPDALDVTRSLLHTLSAVFTLNPGLAPQLCPTGEGGVQIVWREQGFELDIDIEPDGKISGWFRRLGDNTDVEW